MDNKTMIETLTSMEACHEAVEWCATQRSLEVAWENCQHGDWMLWWLGRKCGPVGSPSRKDLALCCCEVAELALPYAGKNTEVCKKVFATIRAYHAGTATLDDIRKARADAAYAAYGAYGADAAYGAYGADGADAADAAVYAADVADGADGADAADAAADAAAYAADGAAAAYAAADAAADARHNTLKQAADIVRKHYPTPNHTT